MYIRLAFTKATDPPFTCLWILTTVPSISHDLASNYYRIMSSPFKAQILLYHDLGEAQFHIKFEPKASSFLGICLKQPHWNLKPGTENPRAPHSWK